MNPDQWTDSHTGAVNRDADAYDLLQLDDLLPSGMTAGPCRSGSAYDEALDDES